MKICSKCNIEKPKDDYYVVYGYRLSHCNECRKNITKKYNKERTKRKNYKLW